MPRSALGIDWLLSLVLIGGSRFALRILAEQSTCPRATAKSKRALIIGAGDAGALVVRELQTTFPTQPRSQSAFSMMTPPNRIIKFTASPVIGKVNKLCRHSRQSRKWTKSSLPSHPRLATSSAWSTMSAARKASRRAPCLGFMNCSAARSASTACVKWTSPTSCAATMSA
ncbi:MAG: hypothetical protein MZV64_24180 [Ignavibacteriales bacterium]|nr:hypothetical protein [Ignavibacteriales bacterium]